MKNNEFKIPTQNQKMPLNSFWIYICINRITVFQYFGCTGFMFHPLCYGNVFTIRAAWGHISKKKKRRESKSDQIKNCDKVLHGIILFLFLFSILPIIFQMSNSKQLRMKWIYTIEHKICIHKSTESNRKMLW